MSGPESKSNEKVRPGAILRAMGASSEAVTPPLWDSPQLRAAAAGTGTGAVQVDVERAGDRVVRILARCRCGETIAIECDYADAPSGAASGSKPA